MPFIDWWQPFDTWIVMAGLLSALSCALLGNFLILRKMSMMGDAISHAVLPGLAAAFLISGTRDPLPMLFGAIMIGILTAVLVQAVTKIGRVEESASMGVVFTSLFALGLILIVRGADKVDLDPSCVLYGAIEWVPFDDFHSILGLEMPRTILTLAVVFLVNLLFVLFFYKELKISSFDPALATTQGINANLMHYLLMTLVAITTVASFESVGSILVIAMLIVPGATAYLMTDRLWVMILLSLIVGGLSAFFGHYFAIEAPAWFGFADTNTAGMMAVVSGVMFATALIFSPRHGLLSKAAHRAALSLRILQEDILGMLYRAEELSGKGTALKPRNLREGLHAGWLLLPAAGLLSARNKIRYRNGECTLSPKGRRHARDLIRSHRLWETYLVEEMNLPADHTHRSAMEVEHFISPEIEEELETATSRPEIDPQGKEIPKKE